jgi:murein DD-endopeptidase MepM/ murein hydrolase activator NlpD
MLGQLQSGGYGRVPRKEGTQPLTLIVVPHSERAPVSIRVPTSLLPLVLLLSFCLLVGAAFLAVRTYRLSQEIQELQQDKEVQLAREREMRTTILIQQEEVRGLSQQVEDFQAELAGVSALSDEIRDLLQLPTPTNTPAAAPTGYSFESSSASPVRNYQLSAIEADARGGRITHRLSDSGMAVAMEKVQDVIGMQLTLPSTFRELVDLREQALVRLERIEPEKRGNHTDLEKQLRLLAAAPHLWPTESRRISDRFGYRTLRGKLEFHKGIDIPVWYGTEVLATSDGSVTKAGWQPGYGWTIELEHEMGFGTIYGHSSQLLVSEGEEVKAGDVIALSGNSGRSTGPHLHYEIRLNGTSVDPFKYLDTDVPSHVDE